MFFTSFSAGLVYTLWTFFAFLITALRTRSNLVELNGIVVQWAISVGSAVSMFWGAEMFVRHPKLSAGIFNSCNYALKGDEKNGLAVGYLTTRFS